MYSEWKDNGKELYLSWQPTATYPVATVTFKNNDAANYYSKDGQFCEVSISNPAADVQSVLARA